MGQVLLHIRKSLLYSQYSLCREAVKTGIFKNENIMIGVGQNLFNFVFSTLAWFTVSQIYSLTAELQTGRSMRSLTLSEAADQVMEAMMKYESR